MSEVHTDVTYVTGITKWFNPEKGYGFITLPGGALDVFVHRNQLEKSGIKDNPQEGQKLKFVISKGPKGTFASDLTLVA